MVFKNPSTNFGTFMAFNNNAIIHAHYSLQTALHFPPVMDSIRYRAVAELGGNDCIAQHQGSNCTQHVSRELMGTASHRQQQRSTAQDDLAALRSRKTRSSISSQELFRRIKARLDDRTFPQVIDTIVKFNKLGKDATEIVERIRPIIGMEHPDLVEDIAQYAIPGYGSTSPPSNEPHSRIQSPARPISQLEKDAAFSSHPLKTADGSPHRAKHQPSSQIESSPQPLPPPVFSPVPPTLAQSFYDYANQDWSVTTQQAQNWVVDHGTQSFATSARPFIVPASQITARLPATGWFGPGMNPRVGAPASPLQQSLNPFKYPSLIPKLTPTTITAGPTYFHSHPQINLPIQAAPVQNAGLQFLPPEVPNISNYYAYGQPYQQNIAFNVPNEVTWNTKLQRKRGFSDLRSRSRSPIKGPKVSRIETERSLSTTSLVNGPIVSSYLATAANVVGNDTMGAKTDINSLEQLGASRSGCSRRNVPKKVIGAGIGVSKARKNALLKPSPTRTPAKAGDPSSSVLVDTIPEFPGDFVHAICGRNFSSLEAVQKHHHGDGRPDTGCWSRYNCPTIAWNAHPSCKSPLQGTTAAKGVKEGSAKAKSVPPPLSCRKDKRTPRVSCRKVDESGEAESSGASSEENAKLQLGLYDDEDEDEDLEDDNIKSDHNLALSSEAKLANLVVKKQEGDAEQGAIKTESETILYEQEVDKETMLAEIGMTERDLHALEVGTRTLHEKLRSKSVREATKASAGRATKKNGASKANATKSAGKTTKKKRARKI